jgi:hypothetical protein
MAVIETSCGDLAQARDHLSFLVAKLQTEIEAVNKLHLPAIRRAVAKAIGCQEEVGTLLVDGKSMFEKRRTRIFHGIKVGWCKQKGALIIDDPDKTVQLAERLFSDNPDLLAILVNTTKTPNKKAIRDLPVSDAQKIGCQIKDSTDAMVISPVDDAVEAIVSALLAQETEEA